MTDSPRRLPRPHIPIAVRCRVAMRQLGLDEIEIIYQLEANARMFGALHEHLMLNLAGRMNCDVADFQLDHDPALENRELRWVRRKGKRVQVYTPDANDPDCLIYRTSEDHYFKTHVRGTGAQRSDTAEAKHWRKVRRNAEKLANKKRASKSSAKLRLPKRKSAIPARVNPWPTRGSRPLGSRDK